MAVPYTFGSATTSIPLSQLDSNFATTITLGNTAVQLGNTITTLTGVTNVASGTSLTLGSNGNTTAVTIDTSQNVGIGTSSPSVLLSVSKNGSGGDAGQLARITDTNTSNSIGPTSLTIGMMNHYAGNPRMSIAGTTGLSFCVGDGSDFNAQRKVEIDSSGNLLVGATSTAFPSSDAKTVSLTNSVQTAFFANVNAASSTGTAGIVIRKYDNNNTTSQIYLHCNYNQGTSGAGGIQGNGASGIQFYSSSDARLKENIIELEPQLANIMALKPSKFDFIDGPKECTGFIAQEMETVYPDAIGEGEDGYKTIGGISIMETRLIKAIQEQQALITALTARITALEAK